MNSFRIGLMALAMTSMTGPLFASSVEVGPRPAYLVDQMAAGPLKEKLAACIGKPVDRTLFSIGHRGAALQFPEHTREGYRAAATLGAGIIECDVTFTSDKALVCRHAQNDLATTTNILATDLAGKCTAPFVPAAGDQKAAAECRTSDISLAEFQSLEGKMDAANTRATTVEDFLDGTANWRTDLYASPATLMTHAQSIELIKSLGGKFTPELKSTSVDMPFEGLSQEAYAQKMIDEYKAAGIPAQDVWPQSFNLNDVLYWVENEPEFGKQAVFLDGRYRNDSFSPMHPERLSPTMAELKASGVNYLAPPLWVLLALDDGKIVSSAYARAAKEAGLELITWTLERSGPLAKGGGWYYQTVSDVIDGDGRMFEVVDALAQDVGVAGIFSDWPGTVSFYASCMGLK